MKTNQKEPTRDNDSSIDGWEAARLYSELNDWGKFRTGCDFTRGITISWCTGRKGATLAIVIQSFWVLVWPFIAPPLAAGAGLVLWLWAVAVWRWEPIIAALALWAAGAIAYYGRKESS